MARQWLSKAAEGGHQQAQLMLGVMVQQGVGGEKNEFAALRWLKKASEGDDQIIAKNASDIKQKIEKKVLFSGAFKTEDIAAAVAVGFGLLSIMVHNANSDGQRPLLKPFDPGHYQKSWIDVGKCVGEVSAIAVAGCF